jgi:beta-mannanase
MSRTLLEYIEKNYIIIIKNNITLLININISDKFLNFWTEKYLNWKIEIFQILDKYLNSNKIFIDIGCNIGEFLIYSSRNSKNVIAFEDNKESLIVLEKYIIDNSKNITLFNENTNILEIINKYYQDISLIKITINNSYEKIIDKIISICKEKKILLLLYSDNISEFSLLKIINLTSEQQQILLEKNYYFFNN